MRFLFLTTLCWSLCHAQEITLNHITAAVCQIETGTIYQGPGRVSGSFTQGAAGEIGPWQMLPVVFRERGLSESHARRSVAHYELAFTMHYQWLLDRTGSPFLALASYHRGLGGRYRKDAQGYAARALNLAEKLAQEEAAK